MFTFNYVGGRGAAEEFKASLLLPTGQDIVLWEAQNRGLIIPGQTGDSYYSTERCVIVSVAFEGLRQYFGCGLQEDANTVITIASPSKTCYFKWAGKLLRTETLLKKIALSSPLYRAVKFQPIISHEIMRDMISVTKTASQIKGRRLSNRRMEI